MGAIDWRHELRPCTRRRAVKQIMDYMKEYHDFHDEDELQEHGKFCQSFEQKTFAGATSKADYLQKIDSMQDEMRRKLQEEIHQKIKIFKEMHLPELTEMYQMIANRHQQIQMLKEVHFPELTEMLLKLANGVQQALENYYMQPGQVCSNENQIEAQWEFQEVYQKIQMLKEMCLPELSEMHQIIANKVSQIDSSAWPILLAGSDTFMSYAGSRRNPYADERPKFLKTKEILERIMAFLQASKSDISPGMKEELPSIEDQIITFININRSNALEHRQIRFCHKLDIPSVTGNLEEFIVSESDFD